MTGQIFCSIIVFGGNYEEKLKPNTEIFWNWGYVLGILMIIAVFITVTGQILCFTKKSKSNNVNLYACTAVCVNESILNGFTIVLNLKLPMQISISI